MSFEVVRVCVYQNQCIMYHSLMTTDEGGLAVRVSRVDENTWKMFACIKTGEYSISYIQMNFLAVINKIVCE